VVLPEDVLEAERADVLERGAHLVVREDRVAPVLGVLDVEVLGATL